MRDLSESGHEAGQRVGGQFVHSASVVEVAWVTVISNSKTVIVIVIVTITVIGILIATLTAIRSVIVMVRVRLT